jgi:hypothetical protein
VRPINAFRNRVAHHEPVLDLNVTDVLAKIVRLTELRCRETAAWLRHHCTLSTVVRTRPKRDNSSTDQVSAKLDRNLLNVDPDTTLQALAGSVDEKRQAIVCLDSAGRPSAAFTVFDVLRFISERAKALDGMVDLKDHKVSDLLGTFSHAERWVAMDEKTSMGSGRQGAPETSHPDPRRNGAATGKATGAIVRAHRRY